jgi:hypothetical protein
MKYAIMTIIEHDQLSRSLNVGNYSQRVDFNTDGHCVVCPHSICEYSERLPYPSSLAKAILTPLDLSIF